jgi:capsular polysaccharide biosynthesis protein
VNTDSRNNLSRVLGEPEVIKLEAIVAMSKALENGDTQFTDVLMKDKSLLGLKKLGLPLERIASMLQRRAVFAPSGAYVAGAIATRVLNNLGKQQTAKALRLLVEHPLEALNLDQILLSEIAKLNTRQQAQVNQVMKSPNRHMRELISVLPNKLAPLIKGHLATFGVILNEEEAKNIIKDTLLSDPRHPELNQETNTTGENE